MTARVSVVVPSYRRPQLLQRCLQALLAQRRFDLAAVEIIVVDDADQAATAETVRGWQARIARATGQPTLRYLAVTGPRHGPAAARNLGWRAANAPIIAFTDDDCVPEPHWIAEGVAALAPDQGAVWGSIVTPLPPDPTDYQRDAARLQTAQFVTANCFCRREALELVGGLDEQFTAAWREDSDLYFSLLKTGVRVGRAPGAVVVHPIRAVPWGISLVQQRKMLFDALLYKKHPRLYRRFIRSTPPWRYYAILLALLVAAVAGAAGQWALALVAVGFWVALTGAFFLVRMRATRRSPVHILEMAVTSALIPPLAVFWRLAGAVKFRVMFL